MIVNLLSIRFLSDSVNLDFIVIISLVNNLFSLLSTIVKLLFYRNTNTFRIILTFTNPGFPAEGGYILKPRHFGHSRRAQLVHC
jgi:hypothetical protein